MRPRPQTNYTHRRHHQPHFMNEHGLLQHQPVVLVTEMIRHHLAVLNLNLIVRLNQEEERTDARTSACPFVVCHIAWYPCLLRKEAFAVQAEKGIPSITLARTMAVRKDRTIKKLGNVSTNSDGAKLFDDPFILIIEVLIFNAIFSQIISNVSCIYLYLALSTRWKCCSRYNENFETIVTTWYEHTTKNKTILCRCCG